MTSKFIPKSEFLHIATTRGFIHQSSDLEGLDQKLLQAPQTAYIGFDCTADSLHIGSLLPIMMLRWWQKTGNRPIVVMGGGTTCIGDPSGKDETRQILSEATINQNMETIKTIFKVYLDFSHNLHPALMLDNYEWLKEFNYLAFLRDYGRHFTINRMLTFDSVKLRLEREQPLTFLEFNYMILQAYDFLELHQKHNCLVQMGGSDQWGNIINGVDLTRRVCGGEVFALTIPLLTTSSGTKMGKSAAGAVWLNQNKLSAYDFWQYWRNSEDADVGRFLRLFTELDLDEIKRLEALQGSEINEAKKILAFEVTKLARGEAEASMAADTARETFEAKGFSDNLPVVALNLADEASLIVIMKQAGLVESLGEAKRLIKGGGVKIQDLTIEDEHYQLTPSQFKEGSDIKLSLGKKRHILLRCL